MEKKWKFMHWVKRFSEAFFAYAYSLDAGTKSNSAFFVLFSRNYHRFCMFPKNFGSFHRFCSHEIHLEIERHLFVTALHTEDTSQLSRSTINNDNFNKSWMQHFNRISGEYCLCTFGRTFCAFNWISMHISTDQWLTFDFSMKFAKPFKESNGITCTFCVWSYRVPNPKCKVTTKHKRKHNLRNCNM